MKAIWKGQLLAESPETIKVEGNHYFPVSALNREFFEESPSHTTCSWKGQASYYHVVVDGQINRDAAWYYPQPKTEAAQIKDHVAFWKGVEISE